MAPLPTLTVEEKKSPPEIVKAVEEALKLIGETSKWANLIWPAGDEGDKSAADFERDAREYAKNRPEGELTFRRQAVNADGAHVSADDDDALDHHVRFRVTPAKTKK